MLLLATTFGGCSFIRQHQQEALVRRISRLVERALRASPGAQPILGTPFSPMNEATARVAIRTAINTALLKAFWYEQFVCYSWFASIHEAQAAGNIPRLDAREATRTRRVSRHRFLAPGPATPAQVENRRNGKDRVRAKITIVGGEVTLFMARNSV